MLVGKKGGRLTCASAVGVSSLAIWVHTPGTRRSTNKFDYCIVGHKRRLMGRQSSKGERITGRQGGGESGIL